MSLKIYNLKAKKMIYDGKDDDFYNYSENLSISKLNCEVFFRNEDVKPLWDIHGALKEAIVKNISGIKAKTYCDDPEPSYKYNNLDVYVYDWSFAGNAIYIVLAEGESQPARYKIIMLGYIVTTED